MSTSGSGLLWDLSRRIVARAIESADPFRAVDRAWPTSLDGEGAVTVIAFGKASAAMAGAAIDRLGQRLVNAVVVCPEEHMAEIARRADSRILALPGDHPVPTERSVRAAEAIERTATALGPDDRVLVLLSGGGSAMVASPDGNLGVADLVAVTDSLLRAGATIGELNTVRKHCERLKGGGLARAIAPARAEVLVLSDVLGDPVDVIASGPLSSDRSTFKEALGVIERRGAAGRSRAVVAHLGRGMAGDLPETLRPGASELDAVRHRVIANNAEAVRAVVDELEGLGYAIAGTRTGVEGEAAAIGSALAGAIVESAEDDRPTAIVWGGEATVTVQSGGGAGGPCQETALAASARLVGIENVGLVSFATDGVDGPSDAAGALIDGATWARVAGTGVDPADALARHDSHRALDAAGALIRTGPTGTNVNDVHVGLCLGRDPESDRAGATTVVN